MSALINIILDKIKVEYNKEDVLWTKTSLTRSDYSFLEEECMKDSEFDPYNARKNIYLKMKNAELSYETRKCKYGQIFVVYENGIQSNDIPWNLWGRILRMFSNNSIPFKVFLLTNTHLRKFPKNNLAIKPENINGGYTYPCDHESIIIYRAEDATRVLIHELMHSSCLDKMENGIDMVEAETEAWAELLYIAFLSQGKRALFLKLLENQSNWMVEQNKKVKKHMNDPKSIEFPWRYTIGKEQIWRKWNILTPSSSVHLGSSLRLTYPPSDSLKDTFEVRSQSTIL